MEGAVYNTSYLVIFGSTFQRKVPSTIVIREIHSGELQQAGKRGSGIRPQGGIGCSSLATLSVLVS